MCVRERGLMANNGCTRELGFEREGEGEGEREIEREREREQWWYKGIRVPTSFLFHSIS
jgi:hypothetical protein